MNAETMPNIWRAGKIDSPNQSNSKNKRKHFKNKSIKLKNNWPRSKAENKNLYSCICLSIEAMLSQVITGAMVAMATIGIGLISTAQGSANHKFLLTWKDLVVLLMRWFTLKIHKFNHLLIHTTWRFPHSKNSSTSTIARATTCNSYLSHHASR